MLRRLHWLILRRLPGPFFGWLGTLMFLLLMQFLIKWLPDIAGKGIPLPVILELIAYNLAYMVVLAVPMSVLLASLMAYGSLAESKYYTVIKSTGISFGQIVWPSLVVALALTGGMLYFNNVMLPEANHRARYLWSDIRSKRPGFDLQPGVFYDGVENYSILVRERPEGTNRLRDITIYDYSRGRDRQAVIKAEQGRIETESSGSRLILHLRDGEMHRPLPRDPPHDNARYERLVFNRHKIQFTLSDVVFQRTSPRETGRSTRTMRTRRMLHVVDSLETKQTKRFQSLYEDLRGRLSLAVPDDPDTTISDSAWASVRGQDRTSAPPVGLVGVSDSERIPVVSAASRKARSTQSHLQEVQRDAEWLSERTRSYRVEIYKKFSIALACFVFMFIGAPLGLSLRRGGLATIGAVALGIFMFYWITLVQGEKLSERGFFPPWFGMWIANLVMSGVGIWLLLYVVLDLRATPPLRRRIWSWLKSLLS